VPVPMSRLIVAICAILASAFVLAACGGDDDGGGSGGESSTITVGYVAPLSGPAENFGKPNHFAFMDQIEKYNAEGGINGHKIEVVAEDDQCTPDRGVLSARKLMGNPDILALIGFPCSGVTAAMPGLVANKGIPTLLGSASGPDPKNTAENMFYITVSTYRQGRALVKWGSGEFDAKRVALLRATDAYGALSHDGIVSYLEDQNLELVADESADADATDLTSQFAAIKSSNPDMVLLAVYPETAALFLRQAQRGGFDTPTLAMAAAGPAVDLVEAEALEDFYMLSVYKEVVGTEAMKPYVDEFLSNHPAYKQAALPVFTFLGRTEAELLAEGIRGIDGEVTREALIESLNKLTDFDPEAPTLACPLDFSAPANEGETCGTVVRFEGENQVPIEAVDGK